MRPTDGPLALGVGAYASIRLLLAGAYLAVELLHAFHGACTLSRGGAHSGVGCMYNKWHACPGSDKSSEEHKEEAQEEDTERKGGSRVAWPGCVAGV